MKKLFSRILIAVFLAVTAATGASAQQFEKKGGFYTYTGGGINWYFDRSKREDGFRQEEDYDVGYIFGAEFGYDMVGFRTGLELSYSDSSGKLDIRGRGISADADADISNFNVIAKGYYDFHQLSDSITPYIGLKLGYSRSKLEGSLRVTVGTGDNARSLKLSIDGSDNDFVWGGIVGVKFRVNDQISVGLESSTTAYDVSDPTYSYNLTAGVYYKF